MKSNASPAPTWLGIDLVKNRWIFPLLGALTTLIGGAAYAFSVFVRPLEAEFGWTRAETVAAFSTAMFVFGILMFVGGYFVDKYGPKIVFFVGAAFLATSQILSAQIDTVVELVLTFGVIGGIGLGLTYTAATVAVSLKGGSWVRNTRSSGALIVPRSSAVSGNRPAIARSRVDLPAPFSPTRAVRRPGATVRSTRSGSSRPSRPTSAGRRSSATSSAPRRSARSGRVSDRTTTSVASRAISRTASAMGRAGCRASLDWAAMIS